MNINFRNKQNGWKKFCISIKDKSNNYIRYHREDTFMLAFLQNIILRESCYNCSFKKYNRISDITLADFWGIDKIASDMFDDKGTSLVIVNSNKGKKLLEEIKDKTVNKRIRIEEALQYNSCMTKSVQINSKREEFFNQLDKMPFEELMDVYTKI